ncbi:chorismate mutase [Alkalicoccobacillus porphyridii]|uniref:Uncharacterized protein n=1 Tax=Alkalicoccobacillus porphyridii TaxID=2597270 RepID=A0A554A2K2_9BACI|nr:chorismate mutase [Alkalicoccobacillus porphyridii]TSB47921.1 hypothetical protein FN960_05295 [Alkalicoccobacillus porphyridii]
MYHSSFEPPTDYYDPSIQDIDEQICKLVNERKKRSDNNPGFPPQRLLSSWAKEYQFYEEFLNGLFSTLVNEDLQQPIIVPKVFLKNIPILKAHGENDVFYSMTTMRQFQNASLIYLTCDRYIPAEALHQHEHHEYPHLELFIEGDDKTYNCQWQGGGGSADHMSNTYVVSPPLPDDVSGLTFVFREFKTPSKREATGYEFTIMC